MARPRSEVKSRFFPKIEIVESGCHEWKSTLTKHGYGKFWNDGKQIPAHRMAWIIANGPIPDETLVLHKCDNRKCVNPEHLYLGSSSDNAKDRTERCPWWGRMQYSFDDIEECRRLYSMGMSQQSIADKFGMHQTQVSRYVRQIQRKFR